MRSWKAAAGLMLSLVTAGTAFAAAPPAATYPLSLTRGSRLMIDARVNGHAVHALLDSAAEATLIDYRFGRTLKLANGEHVTGQGSGKDAFQASLVNGVTLEALGVRLPDQTVAITDLSEVGQRLLGHRLDVILGREIFDAARLQIDIEGRHITVVARDEKPHGTAMELQTEHGIETMPARVEGGEPIRATFDLGNGAHVLISKSLADHMHLLTDGRAVRIERGGGLGGAAARQVVHLKSIELAGQRFADVEAAIDLQDSASDLNVGVSILRKFLITADYAQHRLWLMPLKAASESPGPGEPRAAR